MPRRNIFKKKGIHKKNPESGTTSSVREVYWADVEHQMDVDGQVEFMFEWDGVPANSMALTHLAQPECLFRRHIIDSRGRVENAVMKKWAEINIPGLDFGPVPVSFLCPRDEDGRFDLNGLRALNSGVQWFFGTHVGRRAVQQLLAVQDKINAKTDRARNLRLDKLRERLSGDT